MSFSNLREMIMRHEGFREKAYTDSEGILSIAFGRNIQQVGVTREEGLFLLANDIRRVVNEAADHFYWFKSLNVPRQDVVLSMLYNLGLVRFNTFTKFTAALSFQNYDKAATEMLDSKWASQVGERAKELAQIMRSGVYPIL